MSEHRSDIVAQAPRDKVPHDRTADHTTNNEADAHGSCGVG